MTRLATRQAFICPTFTLRKDHILTESLIQPKELYSELVKIIKGCALTSVSTPILLHPNLNFKLMGSPLRGQLRSNVNPHVMVEEKKCRSHAIYDRLGLHDQWQNELPINPADDYKTKLQLMKAFPKFIHVPSFRTGIPLHIHISSWNANINHTVAIRGEIGITLDQLSANLNERTLDGRIYDDFFSDLYNYNATQSFDPDAVLEADPNLNHLSQNFLSGFIDFVTSQKWADELFPMLPQELIAEHENLQTRVETSLRSMTTNMSPRIMRDMADNLLEKWTVSTEFSDFREFADSLDYHQPNSRVRLTLIESTPNLDGLEGVGFVIARTMTAVCNDDGDLTLSGSPEEVLITLPKIQKSDGIYN